MMKARVASLHVSPRPAARTRPGPPACRQSHASGLRRRPARRVAARADFNDNHGVEGREGAVLDKGGPQGGSSNKGLMPSLPWLRPVAFGRAGVREKEGEEAEGPTKEQGRANGHAEGKGN